MNRILQLLCLTFLISTLSFSQNQNDNIKYFDENYHPMTKDEHNKRKWNNGMFSMEGDSIHHRVLVFYKILGTIKNKEDLDSLLASATNTEIDPSKPLFIYYYPGKDPCNSSGTFDRKKTAKVFNAMERRVNRIKESTFLYVYKDIEGLFGRFDGYRNWIKDPGGTIERLFFDRHYPCSSFVIISEEGNFFSRFGEMHPEDAVNMMKELLKK